MSLSKTKAGAGCVGASLVLATITSMFSGDMSIWTGILAILGEIGVTVLVFGIRDTNLINGITD